MLASLSWIDNQVAGCAQRNAIACAGSLYNCHLQMRCSHATWRFVSETDDVSAFFS